MYVFYVFTVALANLALGYGTALQLRRSSTRLASNTSTLVNALAHEAAATVAVGPPAATRHPASPTSDPTPPARSRTAFLDAADSASSDDSSGKSSLIGRAEFDALLVRWRQDDPVQERSVTLGLVTIDQFAQVREAQGTPIADRLREQLELLIDDSVRKPRGTDFAVRYNEQRFAFFFGDTTPQEATHAIERIRHSVARARFVIGRETLELTASCGLAGLLRDEPDASLLARLEFAARQSSILGGNRSCVDAGHGPVPVDPIAVDVPERTVILEA